MSKRIHDIACEVLVDAGAVDVGGELNLAPMNRADAVSIATSVLAVVIASSFCDDDHVRGVVTDAVGTHLREYVANAAKRLRFNKHGEA